MVLDLLEQGDDLPDLRDLQGVILLGLLRVEQRSAPDHLASTACSIARWTVAGTWVVAVVGVVALLGSGVPAVPVSGVLLLAALVSSLRYFRRGGLGWGAGLLAAGVALATVSLFALFYVASPLSSVSAVSPWLYVNVLACTVMPCAVAFHLQVTRRSH
jgi:hypothetical protein